MTPSEKDLDVHTGKGYGTRLFGGFVKDLIFAKPSLGIASNKGQGCSLPMGAIKKGPLVGWVI